MQEFRDKVGVAGAQDFDTGDWGLHHASQGSWVYWIAIQS